MTREAHVVATTFQSSQPFYVEADVADEGLVPIGCTPAPEPLAIPPCRAWWVSPTGDPARWPDLPGYASLPRLDAARLARTLAEVESRALPGLALFSKPLDDLGDATLERLPPCLEALCLRRSFTRRGLGPLARLERLRWLDISEMEATELSPLRALAALTTVDVSANTVESLDVLPRSVVGLGLRVLGVERLLPDLATFPSLRRLDLTALHLSTGIDDDGVAALTHLPLEELRLDLCVKLTDRTIVALARMSSLKVLSLAECARITAEGLTALERSSGLRWLRIGLDLVGTKRDRQARERARERLRRALPACRVE